MLSSPHSSWDDKIDLAIVNLKEEPGDNFHRVYMIKAADVFYLSQEVTRLPNEKALLTSAMDNYVSIALRSDYSTRANKNTQNAYPPKGFFSPIRNINSEIQRSPSRSSLDGNDAFLSNGDDSQAQQSGTEDTASDISEVSYGRRKKRQRKQKDQGVKKMKVAGSPKKRKAESPALISNKKLKSDIVETNVLEILDSYMTGSDHSFSRWKDFYDQNVGEEVCPYSLFSSIK